jgi:transcriptional regulator GlxA family with amidase domain
MAKAFFMSIRNFHRVFLHEFGLPPHRYLQLRRIERAQKLLENPRLSLKTVLDQVGVSDPVSFRKMFQRELGISPAAYRTRMISLFPQTKS